MASITDIIKKGGDAVQIFERIDELFQRVEIQGRQIIELQSEIISLKTLLEERTNSLEKLLHERGNTIKAEVSRDTVETIASKLYDINDRFNEKISGMETRLSKALENRSNK